MWQTIRAFFGTSLGKVGALTAIKVWQVALAVTVVSASAATYTYVQLNNQSAVSNTPQEVVVFIGGLNTTMKDCHEDTFDDDTHSNILLLLLSQAVGIANPYTKGCNALDPGHSYFSEPRSILRYSYNGGSMDVHGFWHPKDYDPCTSVNQFSLAKDVQTFDAMLDMYHQMFPNAHFIVVGHSMGGLVGLQGAYDYIVNKHNNDIDKVVTIDSPLKGIQVANKNWAQFLSGHCNSSGPVVTTDLVKINQEAMQATHADLQCNNSNDPRQASLSWCKGQLLAQQGVGVVTFGNEQDSLFCGGLTQTLGGLDYTCYTQTLSSAYSVMSKLYNLTPLPTEGFAIGNLWDTSLGAGHFTLLETPAREMEVVRSILAPVVTIQQPTLQSATFTSSQGTALPFSASVRCLWGQANRAEARVVLKDGTNLLVGTAVATSSDTLALQGVAHLPTSQQNTTGMFYVEAGNSACQYPAGIDPQVHVKAVPTNTDYLVGKDSSIPFTLNSGTSGTQIYHSPSLTQPSSSSDDARLLTRSNGLTVPAAQQFSLYLDYENSGNTPWSDANSYQLTCDTNNIASANCMGGMAQGMNGITVPPGDQALFYLTLTAPSTPGTYTLPWLMSHKGTSFGQNQSFVTVKIVPPVTVPMPPTQTTCPQNAQGRAAVIKPLALGNDQNIVYLDNEGSFDQPQSGMLKRYDVKTGQTIDILTLPSTWFYQAQISADGQWILLVADTNGIAAIQMIRMDGQGLQTLYCTQAQYISDVQWSPDEASVAFAIISSGSAIPTTTVFLLSTKDGQLRTLVSSQGPFSSCCVQLSWLDITHISIIGTAGTRDIPDDGDPLVLDTSQSGVQPQSALQSLFHPTIPANGSNSIGQPCYDFASGRDLTQIFVSQCSLTRHFPMASDDVVQEGPSTISVRSTTGGPQRTIYSNPSFAIAAIQTISPTKLLFYVDNYSSHAGQQVDTSQNGLWTINTDGSGLTRLTTAAVGETKYVFFQVPSPTWLVISRDGSMYASSTSNNSTGNQSLLFGSLNGGPPVVFLSKQFTYTTFGARNGYIALVGWTSM